MSRALIVLSSAIAALTPLSASKAEVRIESIFEAKAISVVTDVMVCPGRNYQMLSSGGGGRPQDANIIAIFSGESQVEISGYKEIDIFNKNSAYMVKAHAECLKGDALGLVLVGSPSSDLARLGVADLLLYLTIKGNKVSEVYNVCNLEREIKAEEKSDAKKYCSGFYQPI